MCTGDTGQTDILWLHFQVSPVDFLILDQLVSDWLFFIHVFQFVPESAQ